jgi:hypothetical protein
VPPGKCLYPWSFAAEARRFISTNEIVNRQDLVDELDFIADGTSDFVCL